MIFKFANNFSISKSEVSRLASPGSWTVQPFLYYLYNYISYLRILVDCWSLIWKSTFMIAFEIIGRLSPLSSILDRPSQQPSHHSLTPNGGEPCKRTILQNTHSPWIVMFTHSIFMVLESISIPSSSVQIEPYCVVMRIILGPTHPRWHCHHPFLPKAHPWRWTFIMIILIVMMMITMKMKRHQV